MSGIYANNIVSRMPITWWEPVGGEAEIKQMYGESYACEGDPEHGFILLVITKDNRIVEVSVRNDDVRLDTEKIAADEAKAKSKIVSPPPNGSGPLMS